MTERPASASPDLVAAKMAALGKMSAALTHEMNNPAAAAQRAAADLGDLVRRLTDIAREYLVNHSDGPKESLSTILDEAMRPGSQHLDPIAQSELEETVIGWLEQHGIPEGWKLGPDLVEVGLNLEWLKRLEEAVPATELENAVTWVACSAAANRRIDEIVQSTTRLTELVSAVKNYSYVDRSPEHPVDVHEGIESTLVILGHRLKGIQVVRDFDRNLPPVLAHAGELNQVWTNLIDNAADALGGSGKITIKTSQDSGRILVEIADNGPGIPPELRPHIFEPFFTTKTLGTGLGLGLDISARIVTERHGGSIEVESGPGDTRFRVWLPVDRRAKG